MLRNETIKHFAIMEIVFENMSIGSYKRKTNEQIAEINAKAERRSADYASKMPYDRLCDHIKHVIDQVHKNKIPGIGKLSLLKECADEEPERFGDLLAQVMKDEQIQ